MMTTTSAPSNESSIRPNPLSPPPPPLPRSGDRVHPSILPLLGRGDNRARALLLFQRRGGALATGGRNNKGRRARDSAARARRLPTYSDGRDLQRGSLWGEAAGATGEVGKVVRGVGNDRSAKEKEEIVQRKNLCSEEIINIFVLPTDRPASPSTRQLKQHDLRPLLQIFKAARSSERRSKCLRGRKH